LRYVDAYSQNKNHLYYWECFWIRSLMLGKGVSLIIYFVQQSWHFLSFIWHLHSLYINLFVIFLFFLQNIFSLFRDQMYFVWVKHRIYVEFIYSLNFRSFLTIISNYYLIYAVFDFQQIVSNDNRFKLQFIDSFKSNFVWLEANHKLYNNLSDSIFL
jgi:hypothetical protein